MGQGANGQIIKSSNHVGTHMDGEFTSIPTAEPLRYSADFWSGRALSLIFLRTWAIMIYIHLRC